MTRVVLTGTIGSAVCAALLAPGDEMVALSRDPERARAALGDQVEVHARTEPTKRRAPAGEPIAQRYSEQAMARIRDSRVQGTRLHAAALREVTGDSRPAVLISVEEDGLSAGRRGNAPAAARRLDAQPNEGYSQGRF